MAEKKLESIKGTVEEITFYNQDNGYTVMEISCGNEAVTVVGNFSQLAVGSQIERRVSGLCIRLTEGSLKQILLPKHSRRMRQEYCAIFQAV